MFATRLVWLEQLGGAFTKLSSVHIYQPPFSIFIFPNIQRVHVDSWAQWTACMCVWMNDRSLTSSMACPFSAVCPCVCVLYGGLSVCLGAAAPKKRCPENMCMDVQIAPCSASIMRCHHCGGPFPVWNHMFRWAWNAQDSVWELVAFHQWCLLLWDRRLAAVGGAWGGGCLREGGRDI